MARPKKNNCDYFPHSAQGRNDRRLKAIMAKYGGSDAYFVVFATKEILTESEENKLLWTEIEIELIAGDLGIDANLFRAIIEYANTLNYFQITDQYLRCEDLENDLRPVYEKREKAKEIAAKMKRSNGQFTTDNTAQPVVSATETPQRKEEYSKVNNTIKEKNIKEREADFFKEVMAYEGKYEQALLENFFNYWSEYNEGDAEMPFERKKTFQISKRLATWKNRNQINYSSQKSFTNGTGKEGTSKKRIGALNSWINGNA